MVLGGGSADLGSLPLLPVESHRDLELPLYTRRLPSTLYAAEVAPALPPARIRTKIRENSSYPEAAKTL